MNSNPIKFFESRNIDARAQQKYVVSQVYENWDKYQYFAINAPTGVGKTFIACGIADANKTAYMLTSTLQLQTQYESSWDEIVNLKGRGNYQCNVNPEFMVDSAPCAASSELLKECMVNNTCAYYNQKKKALAARAMITNPVYLLYSKHCGFAKDDEDPWVKRDVLIVDEAHNLEKHLVSFAESKVDVKKLQEDHGARVGHFKFSSNQKLNYELLQQILEILKERADEYKQKLESEFPQNGNKSKSWAKGISANVAEKVRKLNAKIYALDKSIQPLKIFFNTHESYEDMHKQWLMHYNSDENTLQLSPMYGNFLFEHYILPLADKFIFLSATLGTKNEFCDELGIPKDQCKFIETDTPFPPEKSPVIILPQLKMGKKDLDNTIKIMPGIIEQILDIHAGERGIIHCSTYKLQDAIYRGVKPKYQQRLICRDMDAIKHAQSGKAGFAKRLSNGEMLRMHETDKSGNSILLSPSMMEGVDLHDDLSTFQIIVKMPWPNLGDPRINKKAEISNDWYTNQVWVSIMQAAGRSTRHEEDESVTYILDSSFDWFYNKWKHNLPSWFTRRIND